MLFDLHDAQPGHQAAGVSVQSRQKARMRTVFTDSQIKQLEALFELTDYPAIEARAELARNAGLHEETVRVWFKNRRARRKRQRSSSRVKSPRPSSPSPAAEKKLFTSFL
ncbi:dharma [Melanotaenia boesemani]|uniref:dharma n=1 Tax=Melanotaenia boesemani TaxID=1250792 RepID=UPI001C045E16|nr:dharma [Melanotaenia boesemani]